jgi:indolepyruvate ferredoxin oxidoreductase beta subunit
MAQRGGTVISMIKVGPFRGPLIPAGAADVGLFLYDKNLAPHRHYLKPDGILVVNSAAPGDFLQVDALGLAAGEGLPPVAANLIVLGFASGKNGLFCQHGLLEEIIREKSPARFRDSNLLALLTGKRAAGS